MVPQRELWADQSTESIFLSAISECKGVHRCQVLQLDGEEGSEGGEGPRAELARPNGKNWICFHSSSNKQWGNFASAHLRLNTLNSEAFKTGNFRAVSQLLWAKCLQESTAQVPPPCVCATASKGSSLTGNLPARPQLFWFGFLNKSAQTAGRILWRLIGA